MMLPSESNSVRVPMLERPYVPLGPIPQVDFQYCQRKVTAVTNASIDLILKSITVLDNCKTCILTSPDSYYGTPVSQRNVVRGQLFDAVEILRMMTPDNGNRMHINQLPDDCLVSIFANNFSMQKMMGTIRRVCHKWKAVVEGWVCAPKRALKLFGSDEDVRDYVTKLMDSNLYSDGQFRLRRIGQQDHDIVLTRPWALNYQQHFFFSLGALFPNVQHLVIGVHDVSEDNQMLLSRFIYSLTGLVRLSVFCKWTEQVGPPSEPLDYHYLFFQMINSLKSLKKLDFLGHSMRCCDGNIAALLSDVLPQLEHLSIEKYRDSGSILALVGANLRSLGLDQFYNFQEVIRGSMNFAELAANITEFRVSKVTDLQIVEFICKTFSQLNRLELSFDVLGKVDGVAPQLYLPPTFPLPPQLLTALNLLPQLHHLSLENLQIDFNSFPLDTFPPSPVKSLHLANLSSCPTLPSGAPQFVQSLASIFPLIEQLQFQFVIPGAMRTYSCDSIINRQYVYSKFAHLRECRVYYAHCANLGRHSARFC